MKKVVYLFSFILLLTLVSCSEKQKLLLLNWGEYISDEVVEKFEQTYNCDVVISLADSNEVFYSKLKSGTTVYDVVVPSDYMVEKMYKNDLLQEIDKSKLTNYNDDVFVSTVKNMIKEIDLNTPGLGNYFIPYFWGTWGFMYNKSSDAYDYILKAEKEGNPYKVFFEPNYLTSDLKVGMYEATRYVYTASMFYNDLNINEESDKNLEAFDKTLKSRKFNLWGTDTLKKAVSAKNLDLAYVWTGDFLDMAYTSLEEGGTFDSLGYDIYIPEKTIAFLDNLVITKKARHVDLAHKFIDFMLDKDNARLNAKKVGYCTPIKATYNDIINYNGTENFDKNLAFGIKKYYPLDIKNDFGFQGELLTAFDRKYITKITNICNNSKI